MERIRFQLFGLPPDLAVRSLVIDPAKPVEEVKQLVKAQFHLNPLLPVHLISRGKVLPDNSPFAVVGISPKTRIGVIIFMAGG